MGLPDVFNADGSTEILEHFVFHVVLLSLQLLDLDQSLFHALTHGTGLGLKPKNGAVTDIVKSKQTRIGDFWYDSYVLRVQFVVEPLQILPVLRQVFVLLQRQTWIFRAPL